MLKIQYILLLILILILIFSKHPKKKETFETQKTIYPLTKAGADEIASIGCSPDQHSTTHQHGDCTCPAAYYHAPTQTNHSYSRSPEKQYCVHDSCTHPDVWKNGNCIRCPGGYKPNNEHNDCTACPVGWIGEDGSGICNKRCNGSNEYQPYTGQTSCLPIPSGHYKINNSTVGYCKLEVYHRPNQTDAAYTITSKDSGAVECYDAKIVGDWVNDHSNRRIKLTPCKCSNANCSSCEELPTWSRANKCNIEFWKTDNCTATNDVESGKYNPHGRSRTDYRYKDWWDARYGNRYNYINFTKFGFDRDNESYEKKWRTDGFKRLRFSFKNPFEF
jgi:hypothetical protein